MSETKIASIKQLLTHKIAIGEHVEIRGWVRSKRTSKGGFSFIHLHDGSCFDSIQAVADGALPNYEQDICELVTGCAVTLKGELVASQGKGQDREIQATQVNVIGWVDDPETYPISKKRHSFEYLRTVAHLRPRTNTFGAMTRVRHRIAQAVHRYFDEAGFFGSIPLSSPVAIAKVRVNCFESRPSTTSTNRGKTPPATFLVNLLF